jgi:hypothetical protein
MRLRVHLRLPLVRSMLHLIRLCLCLCLAWRQPRGMLPARSRRAGLRLLRGVLWLLTRLLGSLLLLGLWCLLRLRLALRLLARLGTNLPWLLHVRRVHRHWLPLVGTTWTLLLLLLRLLLLLWWLAGLSCLLLLLVLLLLLLLLLLELLLLLQLMLNGELLHHGRLGMLALTSLLASVSRFSCLRHYVECSLPVVTCPALAIAGAAGG